MAPVATAKFTGSNLKHHMSEEDGKANKANAHAIYKVTQTKTAIDVSRLLVVTQNCPANLLPKSILSHL